MPITRTDHHEVYRDGHVVESRIEVVDVTNEAVEYALHVKARQAIDSNKEFLTEHDPSLVELKAQVKALTRQVQALMRLTIVRDLLSDEQVD